MGVKYTKAELQELLRLATILGFLDDIMHWKSELRKLENEGTND